MSVHYYPEPEWAARQRRAEAARQRRQAFAKKLGLDDEPAAPCKSCPHPFRAHAVDPDGYRCRGCKCKRRFWR